MNLLMIAELAWNQINPIPSAQAKIKKEEVIETAKAEYAYQMWKLSKEEKAQEGFFNVPSYLITESEPLPVINNEIDISKLNILRSLTDDTWLLNMGGYDCECEYVRSTFNSVKLLCDDDSQTDRKYIVMKDKIRFPFGAHADSLRIIYANNGADIEDVIEVDEAIGAIVRARLLELYLGKVAPEDKTNNNNPNM